MSTPRATWDDQTCALLLDLVEKQKELCHWARNSPSSIGWANITCELNANLRQGYIKKKLQNKYHNLKQAYFDWRDGHTHTGLDRDPTTGEVAVDPEWLKQGPGY
jgi:hypothetical protein